MTHKFLKVDMVLLGRTQKYILLSALLHVALFMPFFLGQGLDTIRGVARQGGLSLIEISVPQTSVKSSAKPAVKTPAAPLPAEKTDASHASQNKIAAPAEVAQPTDSVLGHAQGVASSAPLGQGQGREATEKERYLHELRVLIERKKIYPQLSKRFNETGKVTVQFQLLKDGRIAGVDLKNRSAFQRLDDAAVALIRGIEKFKPFPQSVESEQIVLEIPIEYVLN